MEFVVWGHDPWQRPILQHLNWDPVWVSVFCIIMFLLAHAAYPVLSSGRKRTDNETDALEASHTELPDKVLRHSFAARVFHWLMSATMFVLLVTAFFPIIGLEFDWVPWHNWAGVIFTGTIVWHIVHTTVWLDFWSIWAGPKDIPEFKALMLRETGQIDKAPQPAKYPLGNQLYHWILTIVGLTVIVTGVLMLFRIDNPFFEHNPYLLGELAWGWVYVAHGLVGVSLVGLVVAHIYFALRPDHWWLTKAMVFGWITRRQYLEHHEPNRWRVSSDKPW